MHEHETIARRRRNWLFRAVHWAQKHPLLTYVLAVAAGTVLAWACEYAVSGVPAALCHLRSMLQERVGEVIESALRKPLQ